jgi:hypothetical protein
MLSTGDGSDAEVEPFDGVLDSVQHPDPTVLTRDQLLAEARRLKRRPQKNSTPAAIIDMIWAGWHNEQAGALSEFRSIVYRRGQWYVCRISTCNTPSNWCIM